MANMIGLVGRLNNLCEEKDDREAYRQLGSLQGIMRIAMHSKIAEDWENGK